MAEEKVVPKRFMTGREMQAAARSDRRIIIGVVIGFLLLLIAFFAIAISSLPEEDQWKAWGLVLFGFFLLVMAIVSAAANKSG